MSTKTILMIDDEVNFAQLVKLNLKLIGDFEVSTAPDGSQGIKLAKKIKPDLILLDLMMPGMDGFEVLKRLKEDKDTVRIPVVMLTAKGDDASRFKAAQLYDEDYITKPIEAVDLKVKIEEILRRRGIE